MQLNSQNDLRTDGVLLGTKLVSQYVIAGVGTVEATDIQFSGGLQGAGSLAGFSHRPTPPALAGPIQFAPECTERAVLVAPSTQDELDQELALAARAGFTQAWVKTAPEHADWIAHAAEVASRLALKVDAAVSLLGADATLPTDQRDINLLGETTGAYVRRERAELRSLKLADPDQSDAAIVYTGMSLPLWRDDIRADTVIRRGDYPSPTASDAASRVCVRVLAAAETPGISGIVFCDTTPPGYALPARPATPLSLWRIGNGPEDPILQMGYTPALRLKCLREEGFDPVDVSPLPRGEQFNMVSDIPYSSVDIGLPFFHDYGTNGGAPNSGMTRPGMVVDAQIIQVGNGAADTASLWRRWCLMRNSAARALLHIAIAAVRESRPGLSVIAATTCGVGKSVGGKWYGTTDATPFPTTPDTVAMDQAVAKIGSRSAGMLYATESMYVDPNWLKEANLESSSNYLTIPAANIQPATDSDPDAEKRYLSIALEAAGRWRGVVLDLREVPFETGTRLLRLITPVTSQNTAR